MSALSQKPSSLFKIKPQFINLILVFLLFSMYSCNTEAEYVANPEALLGKGYGVNKATVIVDNLTQAHNYFTDTLGFEMNLKDFEAGPDEGTVITSLNLPDMSMIEFLAIEDSLKTENTPSYITEFLNEGEGPYAYSVSSSSVDTAYSWLTDQGFMMDSIKAYRTSKEPATGWSRDDGGSQEKSLAFQIGSPHLPTFIEEPGTDYKQMDKEWTTYYAFYRSFSNHPNGTVGIAALQLTVANLEEARENFLKMGLKEIAPESNDEVVTFELKRDQALEVKEVKKDENKVVSDDQRAIGLYGIRFQVKNLDSTYHFLSQKLPAEALKLDTLKERLTVPPAYALGLQLEFEDEPKAQALLAKKLTIGEKLDTAALEHASSLYTKYCALCHGDDREGYAADNAPSLKSHSLLATSKTNNFMRYTIQYGRVSTAMAGYLNNQGGPMEYIEIELLLQWLHEMSDVEEPIKLSREPVEGDVELGAQIYARDCAICHGEDGEGVSAPALGNPMTLATATDEFLKYTIKEGRDGTPMVAFKDKLSEEEINGVTAFLRTRAAGWDIPQADTVRVPTPEEYVLNPTGTAPTFNLRDDLYVSSKEVYEALADSSRMIILDARSEVAWRQTHIPGSIPVPYYEDPEVFVKDLPNDSTWIVAYCACPHAASGRVVSTLKRYGYKNTAIIDEGILVWAQLGYPVKNGQ